MTDRETLYAAVRTAHATAVDSGDPIDELLLRDARKALWAATKDDAAITEDGVAVRPETLAKCWRRP